ncbi:acyl-coenzyme A diphosphatase NUDT19-like [Epargyreus clarus]|uniref:acyl-coenzyme A diphosphatase NUDT19-like n=1 Tax=Epargyreus clarus TaxID=520877 RepID=UPI003C2EC0A3
MNRAIRKCWRDSASLIVLAKRYREPESSVCSAGNYDILLQTRTSRASFPNSVVFPGGLCEAADGADRWLRLFAEFGYSQRDFDALHRAGAPITPIFGNNPVQRHIALRITAIRETFEELGLLLCSTENRNNRDGLWASVVKDVDLKYWQSQVTKDPQELFSLCKEYNCYPDIWSLHHWSNWLTPARVPKRFETAFFITALERKPEGIESSPEVVKTEWANPSNVLDRSCRKEVLLYPPQVYELNRLNCFPRIEDLIKFAKERSCLGNELLYPIGLRAKNGLLHLLPGDHLYPSTVDYYDPKIVEINSTIEELFEENQSFHRFVCQGTLDKLVIRNYTPVNHVNMGDKVITVKLTIH